MSSDEQIPQLLQDFLVARLGAAARPRLHGLARVATGRSRENWLVDLSWSETSTSSAANEERRQPLIVRVDPDGGLLETDRATEFAVLQALDRSDLPAPTPRWLDPTGDELGRPALIMVREPGECDYFVLNGERALDERVGLARRFCELLAHVHRLDWQELGLAEVLTDPGPGNAARHELDQWQAILRRDQLEPYPELELAAHWLARHAPTNVRTTLVHGDYKPGNVLLVDGEPGALLDWELAHLGDPHEDLGWVTQPLRILEHLIPGAWERDQLLDHYEAVAGWRPDRDAIAWWNVLACYKTAVMQVSGLRSYIEGRADELYQPTAAVLLVLLDAVQGRS